MWDSKTRKFANKYPLRISSLYLFINNELAIYKRMADWGTKNSRQAALNMALERHPDFHIRVFGFSRLVMLIGFNIVGGLEPLHIAD